jgi:hypothetical protein
MTGEGIYKQAVQDEIQKDITTVRAMKNGGEIADYLRGIRTGPPLSKEEHNSRMTAILSDKGVQMKLRDEAEKDTGSGFFWYKKVEEARGKVISRPTVEELCMIALDNRTPAASREIILRIFEKDVKGRDDQLKIELPESVKERIGERLKELKPLGETSREYRYIKISSYDLEKFREIMAKLHYPIQTSF